MSSRNFRKLCKKNALQPADDSSEEEYEPVCTRATIKSLFEGLEVSSPKPSPEQNSDESSDDSHFNVRDAQPKKKKNNRKKKAKVSRIKEMKEIDKLMKEMNSNVTSDPVVASTSTCKPNDPEQAIQAVQHNHLQVNYELRRVFGPEDPEERIKNIRGRQAKLTRTLQRSLIIPLGEIYDQFRRVGLSMSVESRNPECKLFTFNHGEEYRIYHTKFLNNYDTLRNSLALLESARATLHVEGLLEGADMMFQMEEYTAAKNFVEQVVAYMQYCAHPFFDLTSETTRLEYKYNENRPFHVALLKYLYLLTNRACHRTALEIAKLLLNLDPSDPLAMMLIIDVIAVRAREHQWFIDATDVWVDKRQIGMLFNFKYSYALCKFHVAMTDNKEQTRADKLLQEAVMRFPTVAMKILESANQKIPDKFKHCALFSDKTTPKRLQQLIVLHAKLAWSRWRERPVMDWLMKNTEEVVDCYSYPINKSDMQIKAKIKEYEKERMYLFQEWPEEVARHMCVIKPMASLLVEDFVPDIVTGLSADPPPCPESIDRNSYLRLQRAASGSRSALREFFASMRPEFVLHNVREDFE